MENRRMEVGESKNKNRKWRSQQVWKVKMKCYDFDWTEYVA